MSTRARASLLALALCAHPARAFNYEEHAHLTAEGIRQAFAYDEGLGQLLNDLQASSNGGLCASESDYWKRTSGCFTVAELPALADHAAHPVELLSRWLLHTAPPSPDHALAVYLQSQGLLAWPMDQCGREVSPPDVGGMLAATDFEPERFGQRPVEDSRARELELEARAGQQRCAALHGPAHFRLPTVPPIGAAYVALPNAARAYATFHTQALLYAQLSAKQSTPDEQRARWRALAALSELFALHFLQDGVAAGHMIADYFRLNEQSIRRTHDAYGARGIEAVLPEALCERVLETLAGNPAVRRLRSACSVPRDQQRMWRVVRIAGDHALSAGALTDERDVTGELAAFLSAQSLTEVARAAAGEASPGLRDRGFQSRCTAALAGCAQAGPQAMPLACAQAWAASPDCTSEQLVNQTLLDGGLSAVTMLPAPAIPYTADHMFSGWGGAATLSTVVFAGNSMRSGLSIGAGVTYHAPRSYCCGGWAFAAEGHTAVYQFTSHFIAEQDGSGLRLAPPVALYAGAGASAGWYPWEQRRGFLALHLSLDLPITELLDVKPLLFQAALEVGLDLIDEDRTSGRVSMSAGVVRMISGQVLDDDSRWSLVLGPRISLAFF